MKYLKDLPKYYIVGINAIKISRDAQGQLGAFRYNPATDDFELAMWSFNRIFLEKGDDIESVTESEFEKYAQGLRATPKNSSADKATK